MLLPLSHCLCLNVLYHCKSPCVSDHLLSDAFDLTCACTVLLSCMVSVPFGLYCCLCTAALHPPMLCCVRL
jgi:hypothetical protein